MRKGGNVIIEGVYPELDCGRYAVKREVGDVLQVRADIFKEGHDVLAAVLKHREKGADLWAETPMEVENAGLDRWRGSFDLTRNARYEYTIEAWFDEFETWRLETGKKVDDGQVVELELIEGREIVQKAAERSGGAQLARALEDFDAGTYDERLALLRSEELRALMARHPDRSGSTAYPKNLEVVVDRVGARFAAWYEMFPRSQGTEPGRSATFREAEARLPVIAHMGFDVVYLTPIHPIGKTHRKGAFTLEGTFAAATEKLDYLADLGVTAIELMPLSDFPGGATGATTACCPTRPTPPTGRRRTSRGSCRPRTSGACWSFSTWSTTTPGLRGTTCPCTRRPSSRSGTRRLGGRDQLRRRGEPPRARLLCPQRPVLAGGVQPRRPAARRRPRHKGRLPKALPRRARRADKGRPRPRPARAPCPGERGERGIPLAGREPLHGPVERRRAPRPAHGADRRIRLLLRGLRRRAGAQPGALPDGGLRVSG